jgi:hypothetical protein
VWHWRDESFRALRDVGAEAAKSPAWADYAAYCIQLEQGLRQPALAILDRFIRNIQAASFADRKSFVSWLMHQSELGTTAASLIPHPLRKRLVDPTLAEWKDIEPLSSEPHRWLGGYEHLKAALRLDPTDEIARCKFVECIIDGVGYSAHELPHGYLGDPRGDLALLTEAAVEALQLSNADARLRAVSEIRDLKAEVVGYLNSKSGSPQ